MPSGSSFGAQGSRAQALFHARSVPPGAAVYLCYLDESGTTGTGTGDTSHFVLAGLSIPIWHWRDADREVSRVLAAYGLADAELHTAWMLRKYLEQSRIPGFEQLDAADRRTEVHRRRSNELTRLSGPANDVRRRRARKLHRNTEPYVHLTWEERRRAVFDVAETVSKSKRPCLWTAS